MSRRRRGLRRRQGREQQGVRNTRVQSADVSSSPSSLFTMPILDKKLTLEAKWADVICQTRHNVIYAVRQTLRGRSLMIFSLVYGLTYFAISYLELDSSFYNDDRITTAEHQLMPILSGLLNRYVHDSDKDTSQTRFFINMCFRLLATYVPSIVAGTLASYVYKKYANRTKVDSQTEALSSEQPTEDRLKEMQSLNDASWQRHGPNRSIIFGFITISAYLAACWINEELALALFPALIISIHALVVTHNNDQRMARGEFDQNEALAFGEQTQDTLEMKKCVYSLDASFRSYEASFRFSNNRKPSPATRKMLYDSFADFLCQELGVHVISTNENGIEFSWNESHTKREIARISRLVNERIRKTLSMYEHASTMSSKLEKSATAVSLQPKFQYRNEQGFCFVVNIEQRNLPPPVKGGLVDELKDLLNDRCVLNGPELSITNLGTLCEHEVLSKIKAIFEKAREQKNEYYEEAAREDRKDLPPSANHYPF